MKTIEMDSFTSLYGVFGDPVLHSLSPIMHNAGFAHIGYNAVYLAFRIANIKAGIEAVRTLNIKGVSVTIPHKVSVMSYLDEVDPMAKQIGAVNTIVNKDGMLIGYNSDWLGAVKALTEKTPIAGKRTGIIGAGGAARAIGFGIRQQGGTLAIFNRSSDTGKRLAEDLGAEWYPLSEIRNARCQILINTTPLGMTPNIDSTPAAAQDLEPGMTVMDIVYNPMHTRFLREAEQSGCLTIDGMSMFVYQGAFQFEWWTHATAPTDIMRTAVISALERQ